MTLLLVPETLTVDLLEDPRLSRGNRDVPPWIRLRVQREIFQLLAFYHERYESGKGHIGFDRVRIKGVEVEMSESGPALRE